MSNSHFLNLFLQPDPFEGGETTVGDFISKTKEVCATANVDQPFMCLDLTYISILLKEGYGLDSKNKVKVSLASVEFIWEVEFVNYLHLFLLPSYSRKSMAMRFHGLWVVLITCCLMFHEAKNKRPTFMPLQHSNENIIKIQFMYTQKSDVITSIR